MAVLVVALAAVAAAYRGDVSFAEIEAKYATPHSQYVEIDGTRVHYVDIGAGPVVVLLHGSGAEVGAWRDLAAQLARSYRVLAFDMPGSGLSEVPDDGDYGIDAGVAYVDGFVDELDVRPAAVVGHSVGGQVAWTAALSRPDLVDRLILLAPTGYPHPSPVIWRIAQVPMLGEALRKITPRFVVRMNLEDTFHDDSKVTEALVDRYYDMIRREGLRDALLRRMRAVTFARHEELHRVRQPTLVIWGEEDAWLPPDIGTWFHEQIAGSELTVLPRTGHNIPEEADHERLAALIEEWLDRTTPSTLESIGAENGRAETAL